MNRGRRGEQIFSGTKDYEIFMNLLREAVDLWQVKISAYCLMSNHYHLLLQTPLGNLSRCMRHINGVYTQRYNCLHGYDGQLFRGRFKAVLVEEDTYLLELVRYIHRNPLRASMIQRLDEYAWSSHHGYLSSAKKWDWLHKDFILSMLSTNKKKVRQAYAQFMMEDDSEEISTLLTKKKLPSILGSEDFIDWAKATFYDRKIHRQIPESLQLAPALNEITKAVCRSYGIEEKELLLARRGASNEPRNVAIYLSRILRQDNLQSLSKAFNMTGYSSAGSAIDRVRKKLPKDKRLQKRINAIKQVVIAHTNKSQTAT
jgi:putative transposase